MNKKIIEFCIMMLLIATVLNLATTKVIAEDPSGEPPFEEWFVEGNGTYFEITNCSYLNITLTSSENISILLESYPRTVSYLIESNCTANSTLITLTGFNANMTYYMCQDGQSLGNFTPDENGSYSYIQDLSIGHYIDIQENASTITINPDGSIEVKDPPYYNRIQRVGPDEYWLTEDIYYPKIYSGHVIQIRRSDMVLDGRGHIYDKCTTIFYNVAISLYNVNNVTIRNFSYLRSWSAGISLIGCTNITIENITFGSIYDGVRITGKSGSEYFDCYNITITNCDFTVCGRFGISGDYASNIFMKNNTMSNYWPEEGMNSGIIFSYSNNIIIDNCSIIHSQSGIGLKYCNDFQITNCELINNSQNRFAGGVGIGLDECYGTMKIFNNTISGTLGTLTHAHTALRLHMCDPVEVYCNNISDNDIGIFISGTGSHMIYANTIGYNGIGIQIYNPNPPYLAGENNFYYNNIIENVIQYQLKQTPLNVIFNNWYNPDYCVGNYWSDYTGLDSGIGPPKWINGMLDGALEFDGGDDYVGQTGGFPTIKNTFTMELWAYPLSTRAITPEANHGASGTSNQRYAIVPEWEAGYDKNSGHAGVGISVGTNGISVFEHAASYLPSPVVYDATLTGWNHIVVVYIDKQPKLYLNGEFIKTGLTSTKIVHPSKKQIGGMHYGWFHGSLDEVAIYNRALTATEIQQHYNNGSVGVEITPDASTIALWHLNEGSGLTASDSSTNNNDGTLMPPPQSGTEGDGVGDTLIPHPNFDQGNGYYRLDPYPLMEISKWCTGQCVGCNEPPIADANGPYYVGEGSTILFNASASFDPDGDQLQYRWDFNNDGIWDTDNSTSPTVTYTWYDDFSGIVTVEVFDGIESATATALVTVNNVAPVVDAGADQVVNEGDVVTIEPSFVDPGSSDTHNMTIDWGDGSPIMIIDPATCPISRNHTYMHNGVYIVNVTVTDSDGGVGTDTLTITVNDLGPAADFSWSPEPQDEGSVVQFTDLSVSYPDNIVSWYWDFGDGGTSTLQNPDHTYMDNGVYTVTLTVTDDDGTSNSISYDVTIVNVPPTVDAGIDYVGDEPSTFIFTGSHTDPGILDTHTYEWDFNYDGITFDVDAIGNGISYTWEDDFKGTVALRVTDDDGGWNIDTCSVTVNNIAPTITSLNLPLNPASIGTAIDLTSTFTDPGLLDTHTVLIDWGDGNTSSGTITGANGIYNVSSSWIYGQAGVYAITLTVEDDDGGNDTSIFYYVVVYNPEGGFVTGGGWINSPLGAYKPDTNITGKANFGFVSKYKKGQSTPSGNTQFNFKLADLNFHSNDYEWLVVAGAKAMYKGTGTINNEGSYKFILSAIDEDKTPSIDIDMFRIKIWEEDELGNENVIYDNNIGDDDFDSDPETEISGGNIVIHNT